MGKIVILSGAGLSADSGIPTFRDSGGFWQGYSLEDVATKLPELIIQELIIKNG
ncbi:MAG: Sir2 family NAD-dependent protein deacetylase [Coleofasciculaceae cyanobacterium]